MPFGHTRISIWALNRSLVEIFWGNVLLWKMLIMANCKCLDGLRPTAVLSPEIRQAWEGSLPGRGHPARVQLSDPVSRIFPAVFSLISVDRINNHSTCQLTELSTSLLFKPLPKEQRRCSQQDPSPTSPLHPSASSVPLLCNPKQRDHVLCHIP